MAEPRKIIAFDAQLCRGCAFCVAINLYSRHGTGEAECTRADCDNVLQPARPVPIQMPDHILPDDSPKAELTLDEGWAPE